MSSSRDGGLLLEEARKGVVQVCQDLQRLGLVVGTAGNVSARVGDLVAVSPSGVEYESLTAEMIGVHRLDGEAVEATLKPTSEMALHLAVYRHTPAAAIVHTHAPASTALSTVVDEVPASHYYTAFFGGPVRVAPYRTFGTEELAASVVEGLAGRSATLMGNHGAVVTGGSLKEALGRCGYLEYICEVHLRALGTGLPVRTLPGEEIDRVAERLGTYGQR